MKKIVTITILFLISISIFGQCISGNCENGQGTKLFSSGSKISGNFKNGNLHGQGIYLYYDGSKYEGSFKYGKRDGQGILLYGQGRKIMYTGSWKNDEQNGQGTFYYNNDGKGNPDKSHYYKGGWKNGGRDGFGKEIQFYKSDKWVTVGQWKSGNLYTVKTFKNNILSSVRVKGSDRYEDDELDRGISLFEEEIEEIEIAYEKYIANQKIQFRKQLTEIGNKVGREIMNSYSQLQWHTSGFNVMRKPYTITDDVITLPLKVTWSAAYIDRIKTYMIVFDLVLDSKTNSYRITNIVENRNAQYAKALVNNIDEIIAIVKPMIDSAIDSFKETMRNADYSILSHNEDKPCYEIIEEDKDWDGSITYKVKCKNGDIKTFFYSDNYKRYDNGRLPNTFNIKTKSEAAKSACYCY